MLEAVRGDLRNHVHGVDNVVNVGIGLCISVRALGGGSLRAFPGVGIDVVRRVLVRQIARQQIRHGSRAGKARDPVFHIAGDVVVLHILRYAGLNDLRALIKARVPAVVGQHLTVFTANGHIARPLGAVARASHAYGDERIFMIPVFRRVPDRDFLAGNHVADGILLRYAGEIGGPVKLVGAKVGKPAVCQKRFCIDVLV